MNIIVNGEPKKVQDGINVLQLLDVLELKDVPVAVECNEQLVVRKDHPLTFLNEGDVLEVVHFVGGG